MNLKTVDTVITVLATVKRTMSGAAAAAHAPAFVEDKKGTPDEGKFQGTTVAGRGDPVALSVFARMVFEIHKAARVVSRCWGKEVPSP